MEVFILRHAIAVPRGTPGYPNDDRPLTEEGIQKFTKAAEGIAELVPEFDVILTSPLSRASETALIAARAVDCEERIEITDALLPETGPREMYNLLGKYADALRVLVVGHEPSLGLFATYLLGGNRSVIEMKKGAICCIRIDTGKPREPGLLLWHLPPRVLRSIARKRKATPTK